MLETLFDNTEKVMTWVTGITLSIIIMSMSSCWTADTESDNNAATRQHEIRGQNLIKLSEMGYHPIIVRCAINGWNTERSALICSQAVSNPKLIEEIKLHLDEQ